MEHHAVPASARRLTLADVVLIATLPEWLDVDQGPASLIRCLSASQMAALAECARALRPVPVDQSCYDFFRDIGTSPSVRAGLMFAQQFLMGRCLEAVDVRVSAKPVGILFTSDLLFVGTRDFQPLRLIERRNRVRLIPKNAIPNPAISASCGQTVVSPAPRNATALAKARK